MTRPDLKIIVVGAGPAGLLLALLLSKEGIPVTVLEAAKELDNRPRATHYGPPAVYELRRAGVLDDILAEGFLPERICWRKLDGTFLAAVDNDIMKDDPDRGACLPLDRLGKIIARHLEKQPTAEVRFNYKVLGIGQNDEKAWVNVSTPAGDITLEADYIVGCDGANSQIRRSLHGDWNFPGFTWDQQIVATNVYYDFYKFGWEDANFIIHPEHWFMASRITRDGMWRVSYGEKDGLSNEELEARQPMKFQEMLPGNPTPDQYRLTNFSPYRVHQRLADKMRVGRFLLAGDAAHLCNPFGGMGLTGGIADIGGLSDCFYGMWSGQTSSDILDRYDIVRRQKYEEIVNPISSQNLRRMYESDPETILESGKDEFLGMCVKAEKDPQLSLQMALWMNELRYDFTKEFAQKGESTLL